MIDEPLALLAEAFGQDLEAPMPPTGSEASDHPSDLAVIAAAFVGQAESAASRR
ncbi:MULTISPECIES: hypothetical protein [Methylobacterium]|uniref:Uncharacterized protein n=1 Tax=Methylobacterium thuringiense TaxID=1003091 RepID=A0ABQ4THN5_9HYPH|nr:MULTISPECIES: hypothetical protein [Methylobacterium]GJE54796.1 hypothetical protein EKPJFOCH_1280 [Methylobacterium thuringiense]